MENRVGELLGIESGKILTIVLVITEVEADTFDANFDAIFGIIAKGDFDGQHSRRIWRFFGEGRLVALGREPGIRCYGQAIVGIQSSGGDWLGYRLLLRA